MTSLLLLNGPNLNLLGQRQPDVYGAVTLDDIVSQCTELATSLKVSLTALQSNHEGQLIDAIHDSAAADHCGIILNAGAYTHTSVAIMDAIASVDLPVIEVHLSNIHARESFRHKSYMAPVVLGQICGFGTDSYLLAIRAMMSHIEAAKP